MAELAQDGYGKMKKNIKQYEPPYTLEQIRAKYPEKVYKELASCPIHRWRAVTGIELIHKEPTIEELKRIWNNWQLMSDEEKKISDQRSIQLFGMDNETHYLTLIDEYDPFASKDIDENEVSNWNDIRKMMI